DEVTSRRPRTPGGELMDQLRREDGEKRRLLVGRHAGRLGDLRHLVAAEDILEVVRIDRPVLAGADPGVEDVSEPVLLEALRETLESANPRVVQHGDGCLRQTGKLAQIHLARDGLTRGYLALAPLTLVQDATEEL